MRLRCCLNIAEPDRLRYIVVFLHGRECVRLSVRSDFEVLPDRSVCFVPSAACYAAGALCDVLQLVERLALTGVQNVVENDPAILRLSYVSEVVNVKALAVLCTHQCAVDVVQRSAELCTDLILDCRRRTFVVFVEEIVGHKFGFGC